MGRSGINIQPKPEGNHFVTVHRCYKDITDGKESTAALLSVLEYLAESTVMRSGRFDNVPDEIEIDGDCNYPVLNKLLDGMLKPTAIKNKLRLLDDIGLISSLVVGGRRRKIIYKRKAIAQALGQINYSPDPSKSDQSTSDPSKSDDSTRHFLASTRQKVTGKNPLTRQKVTTTRSITRSSSNPETRSSNPSRFSNGCQRPKDVFAERANSYAMGCSPRMPSQLVGTGLEKIWAGPQPNMFDSDLEQHVIKSLGSSSHYEKKGGATLGDARKKIGRLIKDLDWVTLQTYWDECHANEFSKEPQRVNASLSQQMKRLGVNAVLPKDWVRKTGVHTVSQLSETQKAEFLAFLQQQESAA